jgi:hypothetical protein
MVATLEMKKATEQYQTVWHRVYAPLRRTLAGTWQKRSGDNRYRLRLDAFGTYYLNCPETRTDESGRYTVVGKSGAHYIALEKGDGTIHIYRIEEIEGSRLTLVDDAAKRSIELVRRTAQR